jgi:hypothetical protein
MRFDHHLTRIRRGIFEEEGLLLSWPESGWLSRMVVDFGRMNAGKCEHGATMTWACLLYVHGLPYTRLVTSAARPSVTARQPNFLLEITNAD